MKERDPEIGALDASQRPASLLWLHSQRERDRDGAEREREREKALRIRAECEGDEEVGHCVNWFGL